MLYKLLMLMVLREKKGSGIYFEKGKMKKRGDGDLHGSLLKGKRRKR